MSEENERTILTDDEEIPLRRSGTSDMLRVPAHWKKTLKELKTLPGGPLIFMAHIEKDADGRIFIVFEKERENDEATQSKNLKTH